MDKILKNLIDIRKEKRLSQKVLRSILGVNATTMSRYESGIRRMPHELVVKYADYLGYEIRLLKK